MVVVHEPQQLEELGSLDRVQRNDGLVQVQLGVHILQQVEVVVHIPEQVEVVVHIPEQVEAVVHRLDLDVVHNQQVDGARDLCMAMSGPQVACQAGVLEQEAKAMVDGQMLPPGPHHSRHNTVVCA